MGRHYLHIKVKSTYLWWLMVCMMVLSVGSCSDEEMVSPTTSGVGSDIISFQVTSGITTATTRSGDDETELLDPLVLGLTETDSILYLHTYVAEECERATGDTVTTRAAEVNDVADFYTLNNSEGFGVQGYYWENDIEDGVFMEAGTTAYPYKGEEIWSAKPVYYWPNNTDKLRFYAYAPLSAEDELEDLSMGNNEISFDYTVPTTTTDEDAENQPDLMFAISDPCNKTTDDGYAPLNFRHALSAIKFAVSDVVGGTITNIKIGGVKGAGACTYAYSDTDNDYAFSWTTSGGNCSYSQDFNYTNATDKTSDTDDVVINNQTGYEDMTFMLIPQQLTDDAYITITFVRTKNDGDVASDNVEVGETTTTFTLTGKINNTIKEWKAGYEYIYTISTSSANWVYVFEVIGSEQAENDDEPMEGKFSDSPTSIIVNATVTETNNYSEKPYYKVLSYRYRANNPSTKEAVAWTALPSDGTVNIPSDLTSLANKYDGQIDETTIAYTTWLPGITISGNGSTSYTTYYVKFYEQMVATTWEGDWQLRSRDEIGTSSSYYDLSRVNGTGTRNTANCYVVNAGGYYKFPLYYGNSIKNSQTNTSSFYQRNVQSANSSSYPALTRFVDYKGQGITAPEIPTATDAVLVWQDAYNMISDVALTTESGVQYVTFKVNKLSLQQGNAVLGVRDASGTFMWSWHIWATEHWTTEGNPTIGEGDVSCAAYDSGISNYTFAPYALGWCDPKDVWYLGRTGTMTFTQATSGNTVTLDVQQREKMVEFWIGNNVYFQFGRKDPMVGFMNSSSVVKYNFGNYTYNIAAQTKTIQDGIKNPQTLYVGANETATNNDWLSTSYCNLWNNTTQTPTSSAPSSSNASSYKGYFNSGVKTIYDPSPAGYQVPPVNFFKLFTNATYSDNVAYSSSSFNGTMTAVEGHSHFYTYNAYTGKNGSGNLNVHLTTTGHRWYGNSTMAAGANFNPQIVYLWSNSIVYGSKCGYGLAVGDLGDGYITNGVQHYCFNYRFVGRRAMARPVRPIKEINR